MPRSTSAILVGALVLTAGRAAPEPYVGSYEKISLSAQEQIAECDIAVFGTVVRQQLDASEDEANYRVRLRTERQWKGAAAKSFDIQGPLFRIGWCGNETPRSPFAFQGSYFVLLRRHPGGETYDPLFIRGLFLPFRPISPEDPFAKIGGQLTGPEADDTVRILELLAILEESAGNVSEASSLGEILSGYLVKPPPPPPPIPPEEEDSPTLGSPELEQALQEKKPARRVTLLLALRQSLFDKSDARSTKLREKVEAELSIAETYRVNGLKTLP